MVCTNWVVSAAGETALAATGGYKNWSTGTNAKFYWFDGRDISDGATYATANYDKMTSNSVSLI